MFDWDDENVGHIAQHGVRPDEAEEAVLDPHRKRADAYNTPTEQRWAVIGETEAHRILFIVFTRRGSAIRVLAARDAPDRDRRRYRN